MNRDHNNHDESLLTPDEERELLEQAKRELDNCSSSSSNSSSTSDDDDWNTNSSSSSSSSDSTSESSTNENQNLNTTKQQLTIRCDVSAETRALFTTHNNAWLLKQNGVRLERVRLWFYDPITNSWNSQQEQHVAISEHPFAVGAMRASFYLSDVTRQVAPEMLQERIALMKLKKQTQFAAAATTSSLQEDAERKRILGLVSSASPLNNYNSSVSSDNTSTTICSFQDPSAVLEKQDNNTNNNNNNNNNTTQINPELYVAKAYTRFLVQKPSSLSASEKREEIARHFRDCQMQWTAQRWAESMNGQKAPCPRLRFIPVWVLQRLDVAAATTAAASPTQPSSSTNNNLASSLSCEFFSVEPMLLGGVFTKHNNNNGFVRDRTDYVEEMKKNSSSTTTTTTPLKTTTFATPSSTAVTTTHTPTTTVLKMTSALEMETRDAANALLHFSYRMSNRSLMLTDIQGVKTSLTDPQIHTIDGQSFGRGNLGPRGMYRCIKGHRCNKVCKALKLEQFDVDAERIYLKQIDRKRINGELSLLIGKGEASSGIPVELEIARTTKQLDFNF